MGNLEGRLGLLIGLIGVVVSHRIAVGVLKGKDNGLTEEDMTV